MDFQAPDEEEKAPVGPAVGAEELVSLGVPPKKAKELTTSLTKQNIKVLAALRHMVDVGARHCSPIGEAKGKVLFEFAQVLDAVSEPTLEALVELVCTGGITEKQQVTEAVTLLKTTKEASKDQLKQTCGVGVVVTDAEITAVVSEVMKKHQDKLQSVGHGAKGAIIKDCTGHKALFWANRKKVSDEVAAQMSAQLGEEDSGKAKAEHQARLKEAKKAKQSADKADKQAAEEAAAVAQAPDGTGGQTVTPWDVEADSEEGVDYSRLVDDWGCELITKKQIERIEKISGKPAHHFLRRGIFFSHRDLNNILDKAEAGEPFFLYTGRGPSSESMHLGHLIPFMFTQYLQEAFNVPLVIQMTDDEKFLFKEGLEIDVVRNHLRANAKDIIACGFNPEKTFMFSDLDYITGGEGNGFYRNALEVQKRASLNTVQKIFGFNESSNIGMVSFASIQASPSFGSSFPFLHEKAGDMACLIPCAIDQDPYFRMTREVAPRMKANRPEGEQKPSLIHAKFFPAMTGSKSKMSSSGAGAVTTVFLTDDPESISEKVTKHAFSGAPKTLKEHREKGANLEVDVAYQYLRFFCEDDAKVDDIGRRYKSGEMMTGEVKAELVQVLQALVKKHQFARTKVTEEDVDYFMSTKKFRKQQEAAKPARTQQEVEAYMQEHDVQAMVNEALNSLASEMPADPREALARHFKFKLASPFAQ